MALFAETLPPLLIENKQLKLKFELEDVADLYEDAVVEILTQRECMFDFLSPQHRSIITD